MFTTHLFNTVFPSLASPWMLNGPLGGLVVFFTMLGLVFIVKAVEHLGIGVWNDLRNQTRLLWITKLKRIRAFHAITPVLATDRNSIWSGEGKEDVAGIANAGDVLFPGQPSFAETLSLAYSEEENDEALFYLCCSQELEDILAEADELTGKSTSRETVPIGFLPHVTDGLQAQHTDNDNITVGESGTNGEERPNAERLLEFSSPGAPKATEETAGSTNENAGVSIFTELLLKCDSDAKLALMPELLAVGDEKELRLLESMTTSADRRIQKMADKLCTRLRKQLQEVEVVQGFDAGSAEAGSGRHHSQGDDDFTGSGDGDTDKLSLDLCFLRETEKEKISGSGDGA